MATTLKQASRFLGQATLGANYQTIEEVSKRGIENWINDQFNISPGSYTSESHDIWLHFKEKFIKRYGESRIVDLEDEAPLPLGIYFRMAWWHRTMTGKDLLRQRIAQALSQTFVISDKSELENSAPALANYLDVLYLNAFGNFRDILLQVSLHPSMGLYLSHMFNPKSNTEENIHPDENYAREVMQLFSIGLYELNLDGSRKKNAKGDDIPTYDNNDIKEMAKIFTGLRPQKYHWEWEDISNIPVQWDYYLSDSIISMNMTLPMVMDENMHEPGEKTLLKKHRVPSGQTGMKDIEDAIDVLFNHPNVGPFIGRQLIQRLVMSNPTPSYIKRVAKVFNDNGRGVRGDMKSVIKAILLDKEATEVQENSGKLREPLVRYTQLMRAFNASNESGRMWNIGYHFEENTQQAILSSPTVFNFYQSDYKPNGPLFDKGMVAPEFQIFNSATSLGYINLAYEMFLADFYMEIFTEIEGGDEFVPDFYNDMKDRDVVKLDLEKELELISNPEKLIDRVDLLLTGGALSTDTKKSIYDTISFFTRQGDDMDDPAAVVRLTLFMIYISPDYVIQK